jgi:hypothetical protein
MSGFCKLPALMEALLSVQAETNNEKMAMGKMLLQFMAK